MEALKENIAKYETRFGDIKTPEIPVAENQNFTTNRIMMNIELICSGTELLTGKLKPMHLHRRTFVKSRLDLSLITTVADRKIICKKFIAGKERSSVIIVTGGLGPTFDDITVETASEILGIKHIKTKKSARP